LGRKPVEISGEEKEGESINNTSPGLLEKGRGPNKVD